MRHRRRNTFLPVVLIGLTPATPVLSEVQNTCLQRNRIVSWRAYNENTIVYTDRAMNLYTVTFRDSCTNLIRSGATLVYRNLNSLSCFARGDAIRVKATGLPLTTCRIDTVLAGAPGASG